MCSRDLADDVPRLLLETDVLPRDVTNPAPLRKRGVALSKTNVKYGEPGTM